MLIEYFKRIAQKIAQKFTFRTKSKKLVQKVPFLPAPTPSAPSTAKNPVGRPRKFASAAEKQKDYRQRKKQAAKVEFRKYLDINDIEAIELYIKQKSTSGELNEGDKSA